MKQVTHIWLGILVIVLLGCSPETQSIQTDRTLKVRLSTEPDRLNPMLSRQAYASEVERNIFAPLGDFDPVSRQFVPVLLKKRAQISRVTEGLYKGGMQYEMEIKDEATWDDGRPVTGYDYLFTMKAALNPFISNASWRTFISPIADIVVDSENPKKIKAWIAEPYILGEEVVCNFNVYPEHVYDSSRMLRNYSFKELQEGEMTSGTAAAQILERWAEIFNSDRFSREIVSGCGPYELIEWVAGQQIVLRRKQNHWSTQLAEKPSNLESGPDGLTYYIIPDAQTAITSLKDDKLDIISDLSSEQYEILQAYNLETNRLEIKEAPIYQYYYLAYNNASNILADRNVRNAISRLVDLDEIIEKLFKGLGSRAIGPIHPTKSYFNEALEPIAFDPDQAERLLEESNWSMDSEGTRRKTMNQNSVPLSLELITTRSRLSQDIGIILKENARDVGIEINITPLDVRVLISRVRSGDYELATLSSNQAPGLNDLYNNWHSDNAQSTGNNYCKFSDPESDEIILSIRKTTDPALLDPLYRRFQEIIYLEQPALFLVAPKKVIAHSKRVTMPISAIRPGYFANLAKLE